MATIVSKISLKFLQQNRLADAERRVAQSHQRFTKIQNDYQSLLGITTDLVDTLEGALRGDHIEPNVLQQICSRLVISQRASGVENANGSATFPDSLAQAYSNSTNFSYGDTLRQSLSLRPTQHNEGLASFGTFLFEAESFLTI